MREWGRRAALSAALLVCMAVLLWQNETASAAVRQGLALCARSVIPSLFPFFVVVSFAVGCGFFAVLRRLGLPVGAAVFLVGVVGGYPVGARTVGELYRGGGLTKERAETLLTFCNNAGPSFIFAIAGVRVFGSQKVGLILYGVHILSALAAAMVNICAFVIFFLVVMALVRQAWPTVPPLALGLLELTGGVTSLEASPAGFCMAAALLGWGGVSVHCQTAAVLEDTGLSLKRYLLAKALQAVVSALFALGLCCFSL